MKSEMVIQQNTAPFTKDRVTPVLAHSLSLGFSYFIFMISLSNIAARGLPSLTL